MSEIIRCDWSLSSQNMMDYHDHEWGKIQKNDQKLFELLCLETYQAGLSWQTVLNKRTAFNEDFFNYDIERVAEMTEADFNRIMQDERIIRNRLKINATINNAKAVQRIQQSGTIFYEYLFAPQNFKQIVNHYEFDTEQPAQTDASVALSKRMKKDGFKFVGPTTIYSFMQGCGMINDHIDKCSFK